MPKTLTDADKLADLQSEQRDVGLEAREVEDHLEALNQEIDELQEQIDNERIRAFLGEVQEAVRFERSIRHTLTCEVDGFEQACERILMRLAELAKKLPKETTEQESK